MKTGAGADSKAGGRAGRKGKEAQDASAAPAQPDVLNKALQAKPFKKFDEKTQTWKTVFITPEAPAEPVDYKKLYDVPDCPVFYPTAKEFNHPGKYIESISEQVRAACRVSPPPPPRAHTNTAPLQGQRAAETHRLRNWGTRHGPLESARSCRRPRGSPLS